MDYSFSNTSSVTTVKNTAPAIVNKNDSLRILNLKQWKQGLYVMEAVCKDGLLTVTCPVRQAETKTISINVD